MNRFMDYLAGNGLLYFIFEPAMREAFSHSLGPYHPFAAQRDRTVPQATLATLIKVRWPSLESTCSADKPCASSYYFGSIKALQRV
jgi:hypothetical protein